MHVDVYKYVCVCMQNTYVYICKYSLLDQQINKQKERETETEKSEREARERQRQRQSARDREL